MHIVTTTVAIAVAAYLSLATADAAERSSSGAKQSKRPNSSDRVSTGGHSGGKSAPNKSTRSSSPRIHSSHRPATETHRSRDRKRSAAKREPSRPDDDSIQQSDIYVHVELPRRDNENDNDVDPDNDDQTSTLFGGATENDQGPPP